MNILQLCNKSPYPPRDGGAIATSAMSKDFAKLGHNVIVLAINTPKHHTTEAEAKRYLPKNVTLKLVDVNTNINVFHLINNLLFSRLPYNAERFHSNSFEKALIHLLNHNAFDVIQIEGLYMAFYAPLIRRYSKALISYRAHNIESEIWFRTVAFEKNVLKKLYLKNMAKRLKKFEIAFLDQYDVLVPITKADMEKLNKLGNKKLAFVASNVIDEENLLFNPENVKYPSVFFLGSLDWEPNQEGLIWFIDKVWPLIKRERNDVNFYVAGRNAPGWLIRKLKTNYIHFLGELENPHQFMNTFAVMVVPLFSGSGLRVKIAEGMFLGKAIITTTIGTEGIDTVHGKNIMIADTIQDFADQVMLLISNKMIYNSICNEARQFAIQHFQHTKVISELLNFFNNNK